MWRRGICLTFGLSYIAAPHSRDLLVTEIDCDWCEIGQMEDSYGGTSNLLVMVIRIPSSKKSINEKISPEKIDS